MMFTIQQLREAWLKASLCEWRKTIRDDDGGKAGDRDVITSYFLVNNWGGWLAGVTGNGYRETPRTSWCGQFAGAMGQRVGDHLVDGQCLTVTLDPKIAEYVMVSTSRLASPAKWKAAGAPMPQFYTRSKIRDDQFVDGKSGRLVPASRVLLPGVIATVKTSGRKPHVGDHIVCIEKFDEDDMLIDTVEGNGRGQLGDKTRGEGVVRAVRAVADIRMVYHLDKGHFETMERP